MRRKQKKPGFCGKLQVKKGLNVKKKDMQEPNKVAEHHFQYPSKERPLSCFIEEEKNS